MRLLKKLKIDLMTLPSFPLVGTYPKKCKSIFKKDTCMPMFIAALFTITKLWNQLRCSTKG
jgi:hypothetical protein